MSDTATAVVEDTDAERKARKKADRVELAELIAESVAQAFKEVDETQARVVPPESRPDHVLETAAPDEGVALPDNLKSASTNKLHPKGEAKTVHFPLTPGGLRGHTSETGDNLGQLVDAAIDKHIAINRFPRDFDAGDFSMARYCMAMEAARNTHLEHLAFQKMAPREYAYYEALKYYGKEAKALGEMTSGQDGGFLAPRFWAAA